MGRRQLRLAWVHRRSWVGTPATLLGFTTRRNVELGGAACGQEVRGGRCTPTSQLLEWGDGLLEFQSHMYAKPISRNSADFFLKFFRSPPRLVGTGLGFPVLETEDTFSIKFLVVTRTWRRDYAKLSQS